MARRKSLSLAAALLGVVPLACVGAIGDHDNGGPNGGGGPNGRTGGSGPGTGGNGTGGGGGGNLTGGSGGNPDPTAAGPTPLRRLDHREYNNTVRDLLGDATRPANTFPSDHDDEFAFRRAGQVSSQDYSTVRDAAETLAASANVATLAPCMLGSAAAEEACARKFATNFGLRAYRRPLTTGEVDNLVMLYKEARTSMVMADYTLAIKIMLEGILQSPSFLYHWESGPAKPTVEGKLVRLSDYENASRLSYFLWGTMPDQTLFDLAAAKKLNAPADLEAQARRMLGDMKARDTVSQFVEEWLGLDLVNEKTKDAKEYPEFNDQLKAAMLAETRAFVANVVFDGDGKLPTLLTANFSFVNQPLAPLYGVTGVTGMDLKRSDLNKAQRSGLLTQAAFLAVTGSTNGSNPAKRGKKVLERLMCGELPPVPANVPPPKPPSEGGTTRQRFAEHSAMACALFCHELLDPLGFAFESYDGIGKFRTTDNGGTVDSSGSLKIDGTMQSFGGAPDLARILSTSPTVQRCFATQWLRFAFKRADTDGDRASIEAAANAFNGGGQNVKDLMVGVAGSRSFRYRAPAQGEILQ